MSGTATNIPDFNEKHLLPPFIGTAVDPHLRSPYTASIVDVVKRFSFSSDRIAILRGLLAYRESLHTHGFIDGFQWFAGSFVEDIRSLEEREPRDVDVVTIFYPPEAFRSPEAMLSVRGLFSTRENKPKYKCDTYQIDLGIAQSGDLPSVRSLIEQVNYWGGLFSHRRTTEWKGIVQVELGTLEADQTASAYLQEVAPHGH